MCKTYTVIGKKNYIVFAILNPSKAPQHFPKEQMEHTINKKQMIGISS